MSEDEDADSESVSPTGSPAATCDESGVKVTVHSRDLTHECESITHTRRLQALSKANEIRAAQAQLKTELARGTVQIRSIFLQPPDYAANLQVSKLLRAVPGYGPARVARILTKARIRESTRLAGLSYRQRTELINHFHR